MAATESPEVSHPVQGGDTHTPLPGPTWAISGNCAPEALLVMNCTPKSNSNSDPYTAAHALSSWSGLFPGCFLLSGFTLSIPHSLSGYQKSLTPSLTHRRLLQCQRMTLPDICPHSNFVVALWFSS